MHGRACPKLVHLVCPLDLSKEIRELPMRTSTVRAEEDGGSNGALCDAHDAFFFLQSSEVETSECPRTGRFFFAGSRGGDFCLFSNCHVNATRQGDFELEFLSGTSIQAILHWPPD